MIPTRKSRVLKEFCCVWQQEKSFQNGTYKGKDGGSLSAFGPTVLIAKFGCVLGYDPEI